jgi:hypothetical protein
MTEQEKMAGGKWASNRMFWDTWRTVGLTAFYNPNYDPLVADDNLYETLTQYFPMNVMKAWVRVTDRGLQEKFERKVKVIRQEAARRSLTARDAVTKLLNKESLSDIEWIALYESPAHVNRQRAEDMIIKEFGDAYLKLLNSAKNPVERVAAYMMILEYDNIATGIIDGPLTTTDPKADEIRRQKEQQ